MNYRKKFILWLFEASQNIYTRYFKKKEPWNILRADLLKYPKNSIGKHLGEFLLENGFELIPKVERHDAYHLITGYGTHVEDEIALQYMCFGNGKRSKYLFAVVLIGTIVLPEYFKYYYKSYRIGKAANSFHHYDYKKLLYVNLYDFRKSVFSNEYLVQLNLY